jgi:ABC-2 type transport system ATP-binding protein
MLEIRDFSLSYHEKKTVLENLNLTLDAGLVHGLVGVNGSGKTSLLRAISGEAMLGKGQIWWEKKKITYNEVALLETSNYFYHYLTGKEYLQIFQASHQGFDIETVNAIFQLPLHELVDSYSTGMKKKLAFMAILSLDRPLIILDEPFNGIDIEGSFVFRKMIQLLKSKGKTLLITSHIFESLTAICDQIHYLSDKKIRKSYPKMEFDELEKDIFQHLDQQNENEWVEVSKIIS